MGERPILIVEDSYLTAEAYRMVLREAGFTDVRLVADPASALREAEALVPAAVILDVQLERSEPVGLELANALMRMGVQHVVIATGYAESALDLRRLIRAPAALLHKPVQPAELVATLRGCFGSAEP